MMKKTAIAAAACALAATSGYAAAPAARVSQYDAFFASKSDSGLHAKSATTFTKTGKLAKRLTATAKGAAVGPGGFKSNFDARLGGNTILWVRGGDAIASKATSAPLKRAAQAEAIARSAIKANASALVAGRVGISDAKLVELHDNGKGLVIARFQQQVGGLEVFNRQMAVLMDHKLAPKTITGYFAPDAQVIKAKKASGRFSINAESAVSIAFAQLGGKIEPYALQVTKSAGGYSLYNIPASSTDYKLAAAPRVKQVLYPSADRLIPAYYVELAGGEFDVGAKDAFSFVVAADSGDVLFRNNQIAYEANTYGVYADAGGIHQPFDSPLGNGLQPVTAGPTGPFTRPPATQNDVTLEHGPTDSNDPWLPAGATTTVGNNVEAYVDLDDYLLASGANGPNDGYTPENGEDFLGAASGANQYIYAYTPDSDPATTQQRQAAIVNLFYMNNWLHDWWYHNGFDEASGNAQEDNYGRGGEEGDPIHAEGQDGSGTDNANMWTQADGASPRMQMYIFKISESSLTINSPVSLAGEIVQSPASFGPQTFDITQDVAAMTPTDGCAAATNAAALAGKIALISRGTCNFTDKVKNAQNAGAVGVLMANHTAGAGPAGQGGSDPTVTIPSLGISLEDGDAVRGVLGGGGTVNATMHGLVKPDRDGTMDNGIIAHEWFHYVSNRLIGNANGLYGQQGRGMGEGWSDFSTLMLIVREEDRLVPGNDHWQGVYSTGTYVDDNQYFGIRRAPYTTDLTKNPLTFKYIEAGVHLPSGTYAPGTDLSGSVTYSDGSVGNAEVHASGEIWANTLWDIYASLLNDERYTFAEAQDRMKDYIIAALKITPNGPTFLEARDALLAVASANDEGDFELMAKAFARHGMGVGAIAPDRTDALNSGVVESFVALAGSFVVDDVALDYNFDDGTQGYCDADGVLDAGETAKLTVTIHTTGTSNITTPINARIGAPANISFPEGDTITFSAPGMIGDTLTGSVLIRLDDAATAATLPLQIMFPKTGSGNDDVIEPATEEIDLTVNYDLEADKTSDNMEVPATSRHDWTVSDALESGLPSWTVEDGAALDGDGSFFDSGKLWYAPDNDGASDLLLETPELDVGASAFTFAFQHYYQTEYAGTSGGIPIGWDGAVIEMSVDGGAWQDALESETYPATVVTGSGYNGYAIAFGDVSNPSTWMPAFVDYNENGFEPVKLSYGTALNGHTVRFRFRMMSDSNTGEFGWVVDNVSFTGLTNTPFSSVVPDAAACTNRPPHANAGSDVTMDGAGKKENRTLRLSGSATDLDGDTLTYSWTQVSGPQVTIIGGDTLTPSVGIPYVTATTELVFRLTVSDGTSSGSDDVKITLQPLPEHHGGGGALGLGVLLLAPLALLRRRRKLH